MNSKSHAEEISDTEQAEILKKAGAAASAKAIRESKALGLTITILEGDEVVEVAPDGSKRVINKIQKDNSGIQHLKKGTVLWRK